MTSHDRIMEQTPIPDPSLKGRELVFNLIYFFKIFLEYKILISNSKNSVSRYHLQGITGHDVIFEKTPIPNPSLKGRELVFNLIYLV